MKASRPTHWVACLAWLQSNDALPWVSRHFDSDALARSLPRRSRQAPSHLRLLGHEALQFLLGLLWRRLRLVFFERWACAFPYKFCLLQCLSYRVHMHQCTACGDVLGYQRFRRQWLIFCSLYYFLKLLCGYFLRCTTAWRIH